MYQRRAFPDSRPETLAATLRDLSATAGARAIGHVVIEEGPPDSVAVRFLPGPGIEIGIPGAYPSDERRQFFTNRLMATWALLAHAKQRHPNLHGDTRLWLDDGPHGAGLAFSGNAVSHVLIPDHVFLETEGYAGVRHSVATGWRPWITRADTLFWRGASTGDRALLRRSGWRDLPRLKLCLRARDAGRPDLLDVGVNAVVQIWDEEERAEIAAAGIVRETAPQLDFMQHRYSIDIDGNTCSWPGLFTKLLMGVTVLKVDSELGFRQWYYDQLVPWRNFVPLGAEMGELVATLEWLRAHSLQAEAIARAGRELAATLSYAAVLDAGAATIARHLGG